MEVPENDGVYVDWSERRTCVVLGGRGFLGRSLVTRLPRVGDWIVKVADSRSLQLNPSSDSDSLLSSAVESGRASLCQVDLRDVSQICRAIKGAFVVFFMEPSDLDIDDFCNCYMTIVQGTKNVINACRECKVRPLVYNSSADVVFDGSRDIYIMFQDMLIDLRAQAERLIVFANNIDGLLTCALHPNNVFGPGDAQLVPLLVNLAKCGLAKFIIESGENMSDFTYAENVAQAHVCVAEALDSQVVSVAGKEGITSTVESFTHLAKDVSFVRYSYHDGQSKTRKLLGGGKVSDILLWREERKTCMYFLALALLFYWFFIFGISFISSMAKLLLLVAVALCAYGIVPLEILDLIWGIRITLPSFEISETVMRDSLRCIASESNRGACTMRSLAKGEDWNTFLKIAGSLYIFKFPLSYSCTVLIGMTLIFAFPAFFIYEQYEFEINGLAKFIFNSFMASKRLLMSNLPAPVASYLHNYTIPHQPKALSILKTQKEL